MRKTELLKENQENKSSLKSNLVKLLLTCVVLYFVFFQISEHWHEVISFDWNIDVLKLISSILLHLFAFICFSKVWCWLMESFGHDIRLRHAFKIGYLANLGRYIPGKIWPVLGMAYLAKQIGVEHRTSVTSWIVALIYAISSSFFLCLIVIIFVPQTQNLLFKEFPSEAIYVVGFLITGTSLLILIYPNLVGVTTSYFLRLIKRQPIEIRITRFNSAKVFIGYFFCWAIYGLAFWIFADSLSKDSLLPVVIGAGAFVVAYQAGYFAFFAPGGVGIRELFLTLLLTPYVGDIAVGIAIAARIWNMSAEIIAALIAYRIDLRKK